MSEANPSEKALSENGFHTSKIHNHSRIEKATVEFTMIYIYLPLSYVKTIYAIKILLEERRLILRKLKKKKWHIQSCV